MYTRQEIFDISCRQIIGQDYQRSVDEEGTCLYAGSGGLKCAAGPFVPKGAEEGDGVTHMCGDAYTVPLCKVADTNRDLLGSLQGAHDITLESGRKAWEGQIRLIASRFGLSADVLAERLD